MYFNCVLRFYILVATLIATITAVSSLKILQKLLYVYIFCDIKKFSSFNFQITTYINFVLLHYYLIWIHNYTIKNISESFWNYYNFYGRFHRRGNAQILLKSFIKFFCKVVIV